MYGYAGRIGFVDLTKKRVTIETLTEELIKDYLGGIGFLTKLLYDTVPAGADPLGPENALIFAVGPVNGTLTPSSNRWNVGAKSPATGLIVSGNGGGIWGAELKWAGFDALVITGKADRPSYLLVEDGRIQILLAEGLWGKDTWETEALLQARHDDPNLRVAGIGQAGEKMVPLACVIGEKVHASGRGGTGAVMGSKNLKAVAYSEDIRSVTDSLELCKTVARHQLGLPENVVGILNAVTGRSWTAPELVKIGERKVNLERLFNLREGLTPADDTLPWRVLHEPLPDGPSKGSVVKLEPLLQEYYDTRGWDRKTGRPTEAKLKELGLE